MTSASKDFIWEGRQEFQLVGTDRFEDTLRIEADYGSQKESPLKLTLPTLCITYADLKFANSIGGEQEKFPASAAYGPSFFNPPVEILGLQEVEKYTWIRGAHRVVIGPQETEIEWYMWRTLVIPRLRLDKEKPITARLTGKGIPMAVEQELVIRVLQYADGRHIGGIRLEARHPDWQPADKPKEHDLWVRVINGETREAMPEVGLNLFRWEQKLATTYGQGGMALVETPYTNGQVTFHDPQRPSGELEAVTLRRPGWRAVARCYRPLPGEQVRLHLVAWQLQKASRPYIWRREDRWENLAHITGYPPEELMLPFIA